MMENRLGVQTRSMADAQRTEEETQNQLDNQQAQMNRDNLMVAPEHTAPKAGPAECSSKSNS